MNFQQLAFLFSAWQTFIKILKARGSIGLFRGWTLMSIIINYWIHFLYTASNSWKLFLTFLLRAVLQSGSFLYRVLTCMEPISVVFTGHIIWVIYCLYDTGLTMNFDKVHSKDATSICVLMCLDIHSFY